MRPIVLEAQGGTIRIAELPFEGGKHARGFELTEQLRQGFDQLREISLRFVVTCIAGAVDEQLICGVWVSASVTARVQRQAWNFTQSAVYLSSSGYGRGIHATTAGA